MRRIFRALVLVALAVPAFAQSDIFITGTNAYTILGRGLAWGTGVNNNFIFTPLNPNTQVCVYVTNNNPTNSHSFTLALYQAGDPQVKTFQNLPAKWAASGSVQSFPITVNAASTVGVFFNVTAAAQLTAKFTGTSSAGGSPDTADIFAVQTTAGACGLTSGVPVSVVGAIVQGTTQPATQQFPIPIAGYQNPGQNSALLGFHVGHNNGFILDGGNPSLIGNGFKVNFANFSGVWSTKGGGSDQEAILNVIPICTFGGGLGSAGGFTGGCVKTNPLEVATDQFNIPGSSTPAFNVLGKITNPAAGATILHQFFQQNSTVNGAYKWLILSCSAACELTVNRTSAQGTTCTALTPRNLQLGNGNTTKAPATQDVAENACATAPTATYTLEDLQLPAGGVYQLDLAGFVNGLSASAGGGIDVISVGAVTGIVTATLQYVEQ